MSADRSQPKTRRASFAAFLVVASLAGAIVVACGSDGDDDAIPNAQDGGEGGANTDVTASSSGNNKNDGSIPPLPDSSVPDECANVDPNAEIDCTGKCGPVRDFCTGKVKQCGGCDNVVLPDGGKGAVQACDLSTNTCTTPKITCADLGAECGTIKNTCGAYLDCPDGPTKGCADGKECDPDTNKCRDCQQVTCNDLGYECGFAWLGCGPDDAAHQTDCGQCDSNSKCNAQFHKCEPKCTPKSAKEICDAAKASAKKVECGVISDGCGGTVNCDTVAGYGCKAGESCGVHGIANRCDPAQTPDECRAVGRECGTLKSACTGKDINCGTCPTGEVCNANGVCGAPCTPKTCNDFKDLECGTFDDGCKGTVTCGTCAGGLCDQTTNKCCKGKTCAADYTGKCGDNLPTGCGAATVDCNCTGSQKCTTNGGDSTAPPVGTTGSCCTPKTAAAYAGQCGTKLSNGCGGTIDVACAAGLYCVNNGTGAPGDAPPNGTAGTCCTPQGKCSDEDAGTCAPIPNSCRPTGVPAQSCTTNCKNPTPSCVNNTCCTPAAACTGNGGAGGECHVTHSANGCGSDRVCGCNNGLTCLCGDHPCGPADDAGAPGVCTAALSCGAITGANGCGTGLDNGVGGTVDCNCGTGHVCTETAPGKIGQCQCQNGTPNPYTCANVPGGPGTAGGDQCGSYSNGCGGTLNCNCTDATKNFCNQTPNPNVCCAPAAACTGSGGEGGECNITHPANGCGNDRTCNCAGGRTCWCTDHVCKAGTDPAGSCKSALTCSSSAYSGKCGQQLDNGVGGKINCGCATGHVCSVTAAGQTGVCHCANGTDTPLSCPAVPAEGTLCGTNIDNQCGGKINCGCPSGAANANFTCTGGTCHCVKDTCRGRTGPQPDLCGGTLQCGG